MCRLPPNLTSRHSRFKRAQFIALTRPYSPEFMVDGQFVGKARMRTGRTRHVEICTAFFTLVRLLLQQMNGLLSRTAKNMATEHENPAVSNANVSATAAQQTNPTIAVEPAQQTSPAVAFQPAQQAGPAIATQPVQQASPAVAAQPVQQAGPAIAMQPAQPAGPVGNQPPVAYPAIEAIAPNLDEDAEVQAALKNLEERRKRTRRKRIIKIVIVCVIVAAAIAAWFIMNAINTQKQKEEAEAAAALAAISTTKPPSSGVQASGTLKAGSSAVVTPEVSGIIQEVKVTEGQYVNMGDLLFTMKSDDAEKALSDAQSAVDKAQRNVSKAESEVSQAQQDYDSAVNAYNSSIDAYNSSIDAANAAGQAAYDKAYQEAVAAIPSSATEAERKVLLEEAEAKAEIAYLEAYQNTVGVDPGSFDHAIYTSRIDSANESVDSAREALNDAQKEYARAQEQISKCQVKAPRSGTVLSLKAVVGASVGGASGGSSSSTDATVLIGDLSSLEVDVEVNEIDVAGVKAGQTAEVTFPAFPDIQESAEVVSIAAAATNASGEAANSGGGIVTFTVKLVMKHPDERLKVGMSANVKIKTEADSGTATPTTTSANSGAQSAAASAVSGSKS